MDTSLYQSDFVAWAEAQAEALRARSANAIDWEQLAEEVEDLGRSAARACESHVENILVHLLKLEFASVLEPRNHRRGEVRAFRLALEKDLTPPLRARLPLELQRLYAYAIENIAATAQKTGEAAPVLPERCPYSWDDVLGRGAHWTPA